MFAFPFVRGLKRQKLDGWVWRSRWWWGGGVKMEGGGEGWEGWEGCRRADGETVGTESDGEQAGGRWRNAKGSAAGAPGRREPRQGKWSCGRRPRGSAREWSPCYPPSLPARCPNRPPHSSRVEQVLSQPHSNRGGEQQVQPTGPALPPASTPPPNAPPSPPKTHTPTHSTPRASLTPKHPKADRQDGTGDSVIQLEGDKNYNNENYAEKVSKWI